MTTTPSADTSFMTSSHAPAPPSRDPARVGPPRTHGALPGALVLLAATLTVALALASCGAVPSGSATSGGTTPPTAAATPAAVSPDGGPVTDDEEATAAGRLDPGTGSGTRGGPREPCTPTPDGAAFAAGVTCRVLEVDGYPREALVYVPDAVAADRDTEVSLVFMLHGSSGNGRQFLEISGWREKADEEGFVAVFPTGLEYFVTEDGKNRWSTKWSSYGLPQDIDLTKRLPGYSPDAPWPADDVAFTSMMIDDVTTHLAIDPSRVYVSGFSNGAGFAVRLAVELADRIAAVGTSGGAAPLGDVATGTPAPLWQVIGTADDKLAERTGITSLPTEPGALLAIPEIGPVLAANAEVYGVPTEPCEIDRDDDTTTLRWCDGSRADYRVTVVEGLTHHYPNGYDAKRNPAAVSAPSLFWTFFEANPLRTG